MRRRDLIVSALAAGAAAGGAVSRAAASERYGSLARRPGADFLPRTIAFGSCAVQDQPQPIWDAVLAAKPDLFVFLGDNIYGDTRDMAVLADKYRLLAAQPGFQRLCARVPVLATWDDHDYGEDNGGADYPRKEESRRIFCDFWGEPPGSPRRSRDGIYDSLIFAHGGQRLQVILPDLRFNRTPLRPLALGALDYREWSRKIAQTGQAVPGPYERNPDPAATMLGERQWRWLEQQLGAAADLRIFASSLQVAADFTGWEAWSNFAEDHQRLLQAIRARGANGLFCISGDMHYAEISCLRTHVPYPLWDFTSSGLTETWAVRTPNARRVGDVLHEQNFGLLHIDWRAPGGPSVRFEARDVGGRVRLSQTVPAAELVAQR